MNKILLVDDEPVILTVLKGILARGDREFISAENAAQALQLAHQSSVLEVALVDKNLPDRNGLEVARELKQLHPDVEVILLTGYASLDSAIEAVKIGAFDYIQKPIEDFDELNQKIQSAADKVHIKREQRRLLDRFAESEERYRGLFQASADALLIVDSETGRVHDSNPAAQRLYGFSKAELAAFTAAQLGLNGPYDVGAPIPERHRRKDGTLFAAEVAYSLFQVQRRPMRLAAVRDTSLRAQAQLVGSMDALSRVAEQIARAAEGTSFKVPPSLGALLPAAARPGKVDLNAVISETVKRIEVLLHPAPVVFSLALKMARAQGDQARLESAVLLLAANARRAVAGSDGAKLVIETAPVLVSIAETGGLAPGRYCSLSLTDNGASLTPEQMERAFEPFYLLPGADLELAPVWAAVRQAGGAVRISSKPDAGSTFTILLPEYPDAR